MAPRLPLLLPVLAGCGLLPGNLHTEPAGGDTGADSDPGEDTAADSGDSGQDSAEPEDLDTDDDGLPDTWADPAFWATPDFVDAVLPATLPEGTHWQVRLATSDDGVDWTADERVIAVHISSLDLVVLGERLVVAAMPSEALLDDMPVLPETYAFPILSTTDLVDWGITYQAVDGGYDRFLVDPSLRLDPDGALRATWYAHSEAAVDPATIPGEHPVQRARWTGRFEQEDADPEYAAEGLVDPVICELGGQPWLFYTEDAARVKAARSEDGGEHFTAVAGFEWADVTVPFCREDGDGVLLYGQPKRAADPITVARVGADGLLTVQPPLYDAHPWGQPCTSPVVGRFLERWVMLCAVEVRAD